jgi:hypothetical protein
MDPNQYYADLMQQGYSSADATHFTQQYYPNFDGSAQGMAMMTPPPPGSMEMGGMVAGGFGAPAGGMAAGGAVAAGGAAAAGGGMSVATIAVVSVLVLGGVGTGGYFLYDYLTEPDFYGEVYWSDMGMAYIFEEDGLTIGYPLIDGSCDAYDDADMGMGGIDIKKSDGICKWDVDYDSYSSEDKGDYYKICVEFEDSSEDVNDCIKVYPFERGIIIKVGGECEAMVSDIDQPPIYDDSSEEAYDEFIEANDKWMDKWTDIGDEILDDDDAPSCSGMDYAEDSSGGSLDTFTFSDRDAAGDMSNSGGDALIHILMTSGSDLNWAVLKVSIVVDDGRSYHCVEYDYADDSTDCTYTMDEDQYWSVGEEITISEGSSVDLCDGSNGYCSVDVTLTKVGVGNEDDKVIAMVSAVAEAN